MSCLDISPVHSTFRRWEGRERLCGALPAIGGIGRKGNGVKGVIPMMPLTQLRRTRHSL